MSTEPTLFLHVGPHKTGSTSLQLGLMKSREYLIANGFDYPAIGIQQFGHHRIHAFLNDNLEAAGDVTEQMMRDLRDSGLNIILSSEDSSYLSVERLQRLRSMLSGFQIVVVLFVRNPPDLWPSHWQELIKHGRDDSLLEYLGSFFGMSAAIDANLMHPVSQCNRLSKAFGRDSIRLVCYDNIRSAGGEIVAFFFRDILHLPPPSWLAEQQPFINPSLPGDTIEMLRNLNGHYRQRVGASP